MAGPPITINNWRVFILLPYSVCTCWSRSRITPDPCNNCCSSNPPLFQSTHSALAQRTGLQQCAGCPTQTTSCNSRGFGSSCWLQWWQLKQLLVWICFTMLLRKCSTKGIQLPQGLCTILLRWAHSANSWFSWLCRSVHCTQCNPCQSQPIRYHDLNFLALLLIEEAFSSPAHQTVNTAAVKNTLKQIRYFELHGSAIPTLKSLIYAYQVASETSTCLTSLITQILVNGISQLNGALNCGTYFASISRSAYNLRWNSCLESQFLDIIL